MVLIELILFVVSVVYLYVQYKFGYWPRQNVPFIKPKFPFGNLQGFKRKLHSSLLLKSFYDEMKVTQQPFGGMYFFTKPVVVPLDTEFVKLVLVKEFQHFHDRGLYYNEVDDPLSANLLNIEGARWKHLRAKLTPTFTSGKMKMMCPTIVEVGHKFGEALCKEIAGGGDIEMKELFARFTTDVIGSCAFGLECNSLEDPNSEFRQMGRKVFEQPRNAAVKQFFMASFKNLSRKLHIKQFRDDVSAFFLKAVNDTIAYREANKVQRNDFMNLLIEMKNDPVDPISVNEIAAQALIFFLAGFETSSTTMSFALYELALNPAMQETARRSVQEVMKKHDGQMTYEAITEMGYINQCIQESLRKYPPAPNLIRQVTSDFKVPDSDVVFPKDMLVMIPVYGIQHDPLNFKDPETYDPDRFSPENEANIRPYSFLPFGEGPRNCIGLRFGMMQARVGLAALLSQFRFTISDKMKVPITFSTKSLILSPEGGLWLNVEKL